MHYLATLLLFFQLIPPLEQKVFPSPGKAVGMVISDDPAGWVVVTKEFEPVSLILKDGNDTDGYKVCAFEGPSGVYGVFQFPKGKLQPIVTKVTIGPLVPIPPDPDPIPPEPDPKPPIPVPTGDLWVIFVYETAEPLTREQQIVFGSSTITAYLNSKCVKTSDRPAWRKWDKDIDVSKETPEWQALWNHVKPSITSLPAMIVVSKNKATVYAVIDEKTTLEALKKHGG